MDDRHSLDFEDYVVGDPFDEEANDKMLIPHSRENEEAVLGCVFIDPTLYHDVVDILTWEDFYIVRHKWIWQAFDALHADGLPIDLLTVQTWLLNNGHGDDVTPATLTGLVNQAPQTYNATAYAQAVEATSLRRKWIAKANEVAQIACDTKLDMDEASAKVESLWEQKVTTSKRTWQTAQEATDDMLEHVTNGKPVAIQTHIPDVDRMIGGIPIAALSLLMGDASLGKTAFLYQIAQQVNYAGQNVLYVTLEESNWRMVSRTIFTNSGVDKRDWRTNSLTPVQIQELESNADDFKKRTGRLYFDSRARTIAGIRRSVRQTKAKLVVVDDLRHVRLDERKHNSSDTTVLLEAGVQLKDIAIDEECALVAIHHVTAEEASKFWGDRGAKPDDNYPPSIDSIAWARDLRYTIDQWLFMVPDYQARKDADVMKVLLWQMKDKETSRFNFTELLYDRTKQWFYDFKNKPFGMFANQIYPKP